MTHFRHCEIWEIFQKFDFFFDFLGTSAHPRGYYGADKLIRVRLDAGMQKDCGEVLKELIR